MRRALVFLRPPAALPVRERESTGARRTSGSESEAPGSSPRWHVRQRADAQHERYADEGCSGLWQVFAPCAHVRACRRAGVWCSPGRAPLSRPLCAGCWRFALGDPMRKARLLFRQTKAPQAERTSISHTISCPVPTAWPACTYTLKHPVCVFPRYCSPSFGPSSSPTSTMEDPDREWKPSGRPQS